MHRRGRAGRQAREQAYRWVDPAGLARSLPGLPTIGAPALVAVLGDPHRFPTARHVRSFTGLAPRASETGETDRKGRPMSKAGPALLRTTLIRAADNARRQDPQLARIYHRQIVERGANHTTALCIVAAVPAERAWTVLRRGMPHVVCDTDGHPVTPAEAKAIIAEQWTVPAEVRARRRSRKPDPTNRAGRTLSESTQDTTGQAPTGADRRGDPPTTHRPAGFERTASPGLDTRSCIGNQPSATSSARTDMTTSSGVMTRRSLRDGETAFGSVLRTRKPNTTHIPVRAAPCGYTSITPARSRASVAISA